MFGINSNFSKTMNILQKEMDVTTLRRQVIADNIANVDTPNFKRSDVTFESQLRRAIDSEKPQKLEAYRTDARHIPFHKKMDYSKVDSRIIVEYDTQVRNDGNNVDIDKEMTLSTKNAMQYNAIADLYSRNIKIIDTVLR